MNRDHQRTTTRLCNLIAFCIRRYNLTDPDLDPGDVRVDFWAALIGRCGREMSRRAGGTA